MRTHRMASEPVTPSILLAVYPDDCKTCNRLVSPNDGQKWFRNLNVGKAFTSAMHLGILVILSSK